MKTDTKVIPKDVDRIREVFAAGVKDLLPEWADIPEEFKERNTAWNKIVSKWFFEGLDASVLIAKPGIDKAKALRHIGTCMRSWEPKHEHKEAGCAYLFSLWFVPLSSGSAAPVR